jgi:predicted metal-dependent hydrolase
MLNNFFLNNNIQFEVRRSNIAKRIRIIVSSHKNVTVTAPTSISLDLVENFVKKKINWILKSLTFFNKYKGRTLLKTSKQDYLSNKHKAVILAKQKVVEWNKYYGFSYEKIGVKNQKTRWGSCSRKGNLNFNYKIVHLPKNLVDYLVVHELCHLKEFNHSRNFWSLVAQTVPNYKQLRAELKKYQNSHA